MAFYIIVALAIALIYIGMNSRLTKIERDLKDLKEGRTSLAGPGQPLVSASPNTSANNTANPLSAPAPAVAAPLVAPSPVAVAASGSLSGPTPKVSSEEASGRLLGRIGIAAVIIGISFFLKYAFDNNWVGPSGRVMIGIISGIVLLVLGQYLRRKYVGYSDLLMGGGLGVFYLSFFSAYSFYHLVSPFTAGALMFLVTALSIAISIVDATVVLALVGVIGGFATPFLVASGKNSMMELFIYLTILNLGIMGVSFFKKWPALIAVAFVGTAINFWAWFASFYSAAVLGPTLIFCFITFLIFLISSVARALVAKTAADPISYFLLGGNALAMAIMGYTLLKPDYEGVLGFAAVLVAIVYMFVAFLVNKSNPTDKALNIFLPGLAVAFLSIAVPMQFSGPWIAVAWLVESVFLYVVASVISNRGFQVMGVVVYALGLLNLFAFNYPRGDLRFFTVFFNAHFIITILAVLAAYAIAFMYHRYGSQTVEIQKRGLAVFIVIANILTVYAGSSQIIFYHNSKLADLSYTYSQSQDEASRYNTAYDTSGLRQQASQSYFTESESITNRSNTFVSIFWAIYAALLTVIGFSGRIVSIRRLGLILFILTALKVFLNVWSLGQIYRIVSFIAFGVIALAASFLYVKFKDRLKEIV